ncbi:MAG TPA: signal recognition particle protein [Thermoplasmatales archaeon]|nr:signal recognition particle protein [Thermoplasmatales archaeon]
MLKSFGEALRSAFRKIANAPYVDKDLVKEVVRDIQRALIQGDVNVKLVLEVSKKIEKRALEEKPLPGMSNREHVLRIMYDELSSILGKGRELPVKKQRIMMVGLYGQGKTTTCGKLAKYFQKKGMSVALVAGDVHRPAAYEQLKQIGQKINVPVYGGGNDAVKVVEEALSKFSKYDVIIIDTAGRHALEKELIDEMKKIAKVVQPDEKILVIDASIGQQAGRQAKAFNEAIGITGVILTKMDGTAKGGGALSAVAETGAPILYIGTGEHLDDLEKFDATRFLSRLLGMGDLETLIEKVQEVAKGKEKEIEEKAKKMLSGKFTLIDMYEQMEMLTKMGPFQKLVDLLPFGGKLNEEEIYETQKKLKKFKVIMDSMTKKELENPNIIKSSRIKRIARGAGVEPKDVKELLKHYNMSKKMMKSLSNKKLQKKLLRQFKFGL